MADRRTAATGIVSVGAMSESTPRGSAGAFGSTGPDERRAKPGDRARGGEASRSAAAPETSGCRRIDGPGIHADHRRCEALSVREADCQLHGTGAAGKVERQSEALGPHHQTRGSGRPIMPHSPGGNRQTSDFHRTSEHRPEMDGQTAVKKIASSKKREYVIDQLSFSGSAHGAMPTCSSPSIPVNCRIKSGR